jgi:beta-galactosidase
MENKTLLFGNNYYPYYHTKKELLEDFQKMKRAGFNQLRTAEALTSWDRMEPTEGKYDWSFIDFLMDEAAKFGFVVTLGTGSCCPPAWLVKKYPNVQVLSNKNIKQALLGTYNWACIDNPGFKESHSKYLKELVNRYKEHSALGYWQINNEPGYPFIQEQGETSIYCYCDHTAVEFRKYLEKKYGTLDKLNHAWSWLATNLFFSEWGDIPIPRSTPLAWGCITAWLDWNQFRILNWQSLFRKEYQEIKKLDDKHQVMANSFVWHRTDYFGNLKGADLWKIAEEVDIVGGDLYPGIGNRYKKERAYISNKLFMEKSIAGNKPYWIAELESGPMTGYAAGPEHNPEPKDIGRYMVECFGHGAVEISFHGWREWLPQSMHWGGMVDLEGNETPIVDEVSKVIHVLQKESEFILGSQVEKSGVALLFSQDNAIILDGSNVGDFLRDSLEGYVDMLWSENYYIDYISPLQILNKTLPEHIKVIILPFQMVIGETLGSGLKEFVSNGGTLVGHAKCGMMDEKGWYNRRKPGGGLDELFGIKETSLWPKEEIKVVYKTKSFPGAHQVSHFEMIDNPKIIAEFDDGTPAVLKNEYGKGAAWYIATHMGIAWKRYGLFGQSKDMFHKILEESGVIRESWIEEDKNKNEILDLHVLVNGTERMYIIVNSFDIELRGWLCSRHRMSGLANLFSNEKYYENRKLEICLNPKDYMVLKGRVSE